MNKSRLFISWELSAPISKVYICSRIGFSNCLDIKNGLRLPCIASNDLGIKNVSTGSLAWYELSLVGRKIFLSRCCYKRDWELGNGYCWKNIWDFSNHLILLLRYVLFILSWFLIQLECLQKKISAWLGNAVHPFIKFTVTNLTILHLP